MSSYCTTKRSTFRMFTILLMALNHMTIRVHCWVVHRPNHRSTVGLFSTQQQHRSYDEADNNRPYYRIRDCLHGELGDCADIIMESFYETTTQSPWKQLYRLSELNRLQQGFPYGDDRALHRMLLAEIDASTIVGYVDIDLRPANRPTGYSFNPRPYLSDLCIRKDYRRNGIAKGLVQFCEQFVLQSEHCENELFIRVEAKNTPAVAMYQSLGYQIIHNPDDPKQSKIWILHRLLENDNAKKSEIYNTTTTLSTSSKTQQSWRERN